MAEIPMKFRVVTFEFGFWEDAPHFGDTKRELIDLMLKTLGPGPHVAIRSDDTHEQLVDDGYLEAGVGS